MNVIEALDDLLSIPNLTSRIVDWKDANEWKDITEAVQRLSDAYRDMQARGVRLTYLNPPVIAEPFVIVDEDDE